MQISILLAQQIAQLFLILIMGYAVVKAGLLKASDSKVLSVLMVYLVCPCMILNAFQIEDTPDIRRGLVYAMIVAAAMHVVLLAFTALLRRPLKLDVIEQVNTIYSNAGALVIPLVQALLGSEYVIYSCAFIIVQTVLIWTHANACLQGSFSLNKRFGYKPICRKTAQKSVLHKAQLPCGSAAAAGVSVGDPAAAVGVPRTDLRGRWQEYPDDGVPCRHHSCLRNHHLDGSAV